MSYDSNERATEVADDNARHGHPGDRSDTQPQPESGDSLWADQNYPDGSQAQPDGSETDLDELAPVEADDSAARARKRRLRDIGLLAIGLVFTAGVVSAAIFMRSRPLSTTSPRPPELAVVRTAPPPPEDSGTVQPLVAAKQRLAASGAAPEREPVSPDWTKPAAADAPSAFPPPPPAVAVVQEAPSPNSEVQEKLDTLALALVSVSDQLMEVSQAQAATDEKLDKIANLMTDLLEKRPAKLAKRTSAHVAREGGSSKRKPVSAPAKTTSKASTLAGLWVKGTYPTTGGPTTMAWVMNADNQLEKPVRVGSVIRGARVIGFDGMRVRTTAGMINPR